MGFQRRLALLAVLAVCYLLVRFEMLVPLWGTLRSPSVGTPASKAARKAASAAQASPPDARLRGAYRFERGRWVYVHLEGSPERIGFQHGYLLSPEIADAFQAVKLTDTH